ncbi:MAG: QueT transporter family protein [Ruminococcaceae bacterium]|nr:QueT transporter family protein [Oscillospiraceae bacterium]
MESTIQRRRNAILYVCYGAIIAALYVVMTWLSAIFKLDSGVIQFRLSEALCILAVFTPAAIPGMSIGCLLSNLIFTGNAYDMIFGTLATFIGVLGVYLLRKLPFIAPLPYVLSNAIIVPIVLQYAYGVPDALWFLMLTVGVGEIVCALGGGILLYIALKRVKIFK